MDNLGEVKERRNEGKRITKQYSYEVKLRAVKLHLEEGLPGSLLSKELGVKTNTFWGWLRAYRERGEAGLRGRVGRATRRRKLPDPVRENDKSRVTGDFPVRICEGLGVKFPRATRIEFW